MSNFNIIIFLLVFYCTIKKELLQYRFNNPLLIQLTLGLQSQLPLWYLN